MALEQAKNLKFWGTLVSLVSSLRENDLTKDFQGWRAMVLNFLNAYDPLIQCLKL